jgi:hypothetical protein
VPTIFVGTGDGLRGLSLDGSSPTHQHPGRDVTAVAPEGPATWVILDGRELWRTADEGGWTRAGTLDGLRGNCVADTRAGVVVGTSEAHLYRVEDGALARVLSFDDVRGRDEWYTPWGGPPDARSISEDDDTVYVNVHVGGIVRTKDEGATWEPTIDIHADVHRVWAIADRVFAACARGLAVSEDRGDSWTIRADGLHAAYCRGVAVCGDVVLVSASNGPGGGHAAVYRGRLDGGPLERCREGLPDWFEDNIDSYCLDAVPDLAAFATADGRVFASRDRGGAWAQVASELPSVNCLLVMP